MSLTYRDLTQADCQGLWTYRNGFLYWNIDVNWDIKSGSKAGFIKKNGYYVIKYQYKGYLAHRLIYLMHHGVLPEFLDHIDQDPGNNDISNIREATTSQNQKNKVKRGGCSSHHNGITWHSRDKYWLARGPSIDGKRKFIGRFDSEIEAAQAFNDFCTNNLSATDLAFIQLNTIQP